VDPVDVVGLARTLIDIESTTGQEGPVARVLAEYLRGRGYSVLEQPVAGDRINVVAAVGEPALVFSTHFDCVPPFFPSRVEGGILHGRGACDAKGILAAQVAAAERLRAAGETRIGLVFVAGEERGSDGAKAANTIASQSKYLINGEPTELKLGLATRGCFRVRLTAHGKAAHSGYPQLGESAIEKLMDVLVSLRGADWPADPELGRTHYTVGLISGGVAPNVIPPHAEAEVAACGGGRARGRAGDPRAAGGASAHRAGLRDGGLRLLQRRAVPLEVGHAAAARPGHHPRGAHRPRTRGDCGSRTRR
jgi:acetylornithine deacetylase